MAESDKKHDEIQGPLMHEYDGILEADNFLPLWWLWTFIGAAIFAVGYWFYYEEYKLAPSPKEAYLIEHAKLLAEQGSPEGRELAALGNDATLVAAGKARFGALCMPCHDVDGQGKIGPNLTDGYWLHGGEPEAVYASIADGQAAKGMPPWRATLGEGGMKEVMAYVMSIRDSNVAGKVAEGEPFTAAAKAEAAAAKPAAAPEAEAAPEAPEE